MRRDGFGINGWWIAGIVCLWQSTSFSCPAGFESVESLFFHSKLILKIRAVEVSDLTIRPPAPKDEEGSRLTFYRMRGNGPFDGGLAKVEVVNIIRGETDLKTFELAGGHYYSCAPGPQISRFKSGKEYFLFLDQSLPASTKRVTLRWRPRLQDGDLDWKKYRDTAETIWERTIALHQEASPESFKRAQTLNQNLGNLGWEGLMNESPSVISVLHWIRSRPDHAAKNDLERGPPPVSIDEGNPFGPGIREDFKTPSGPDEEGNVDTLNRETPDSGVLFRNTLHHLEWEKKDEVVKHNRTLFRIYLERRHGMNREMAESIAGSPFLEYSLRDIFFAPDHDPPRIGRPTPVASPKPLPEGPVGASVPEHGNPLYTLPFVMALVCALPEEAVFTNLYFDLEDKRDKIDREMVADALAANPSIRLSQNKSRFLLSVPHPVVTPFVEEAFHTEVYPRLSHYFWYFLEVENEAACEQVISRFEDSVKEVLADPERRLWSIKNDSLVSAIQSADQSDASFAPALTKKLRGLLAQLKKVEPEGKRDPFGKRE